MATRLVAAGDGVSGLFAFENGKVPPHESTREAIVDHGHVRKIDARSRQQ